MSYNTPNSIVGAAIGGTFQDLSRFLRSLMSANIPDKDKILKDFKVIKLNRDFSVFVFYGKWVRWNVEAEKTWNCLTTLADKAKLSWTFVRTGEDCTDADECDNYSNVDMFDLRIDDLFRIEHSVKITNELVASAF